MDDPYPSYLLIAQVSSFSFSYFLFNGLALLILLVGSALVSGSEVAFFSLGKEELTDLNQKHPEKGRVITGLLATPKILLSTVLILNNLINIGIVTLTTFVTWTLFWNKCYWPNCHFNSNCRRHLRHRVFWRDCTESVRQSSQHPFCIGTCKTNYFFHAPSKTLFGISNRIQ